MGYAASFLILLHIFQWPTILTYELRYIQDASAASSATSTLPTIVQTPATPSISASFIGDTSLWSVVDPDIAHENPVEDKHRRLVRSHRSSPYDRELKPNANIRDELGVRAFLILTSLVIINKSLIYYMDITVDLELLPESSVDVRRERSHLEIPVLSCEG